MMDIASREISVTSYLIYLAVFLVFLKIDKKLGAETSKNAIPFQNILESVYRKITSSKNWKKKLEEGCVDFTVLPKVKSLVPIRMIGSIHYLFPINRVLENLVHTYEKMGEFWRAEGVGEDIIVFNSGPNLQTLLKSADFGHLHKLPLMYGIMKPFVTNGLLVSDGPFWIKQRKILMKSQNYLNLRGYMGMLNRHCKRMFETLSVRFEDGKPHTINDIINVSTLGLMSEMITGENLDRSIELHQYHENFSFWKDSMPIRFVLNGLLLVVNKNLWEFPFLQKTKHARVCTELSDFARGRVREAKRKRAEAAAKLDDATDPPNKPEFRSVIDELLDAGVEDSQIVDEINVMMFGGHETGASAIHCLLFALALNPQVQQKARNEVDTLYANPDFIKDGQITYDATHSLRYVERCVQEALRLFPPAFAVFRKLMSPLKVEYKGMTVVIPTGSTCVVSPFHIHRQERHYPNPLKFDPDRFLPEVMDKRHPYVYIPFSAGPRNCIGQKFAMIEMKMMTASILRHFEISTLDKMEDIHWLPNTTLTPSKDFSFQFKKRFAAKNYNAL